MAVINQAGATVYEDSAADSESETEVFQTGIFSDIADLKRLCEIVLTRSVDRLLDKPAFRTALTAR
jgi:hypothetical protein